MPFPAGMTLVEVTCGFDDLPDGGTPGRVRFESGGPFIGAVDGRIIRPVTETVELDSLGDGTIELPATNDPGWTPVNRPYVVTCSINGAVFRGTMLLDYQTPTVQFADVFQLDGAADAGVTYATLAQLTAGLAGKSDTDHTHVIGDVDDLQTQLDGLLPIPPEPYLTAADVSNLVSYEALTESIADHSAAVDPHGDRAFATGLVTPKLTASYVDVSTCPVSGTWTTGNTVMTQSGWWRCTAGGTPGTWAPLGFHPALEAGYAAWNGNPGAEVQAGTIIPTGGRSHIIRFRALRPVISTLHMHATTVAAGVTNAWCTLHDDAGLVLNANAKSNANQNVAFQTGGMKTFTLLASQNVTPGAYYKARVWFTTGTALPTLSRMCNSGSDIVNPGISGTAASTAYGWSTADTGLTDLASAPDQIGTLTANGTAYWMGAKA